MVGCGDSILRLFHGGGLHQASQLYGIPVADWIDLSTGISPYSWPVPEIPQAVWRCLPDEVDQLTAVAARYYGCHQDSLLPVPGSQFAIEVVPTLFAKGRVAVPEWGYAEHAHRWQKAGHQLIWYKNYHKLLQLIKTQSLTAAVVINPNNPTAELITVAELLTAQQLLVARQGTLIVDEAFMDCTSQHSLCSLFSGQGDTSGLIILRSVGKFFGLAGLRLGFLIANEPVLRAAEKHLSPWAISHPARWVGQQALADSDWQQMQQRRLLDDTTHWFLTLKGSFPQLQWCGDTLFSTGFGRRDLCVGIHRNFAKKGIFLRLIEPTKSLLQGHQSELAGIRFGLPAAGQQHDLIDTIIAISKTCTHKEPLCID